MPTDVVAHNRLAWDREAESGNPATKPIGLDEVRSAINGNLVISISGHRPIPHSWLGKLGNRSTLCIGLGGGQQAPLLAAGGATVTSLDNSPEQLRRDKSVAELCNLKIRCELGDMQDLSRFEAGAFELVVLGLGLQFVPDPNVVWREISRIIASNGTLICALMSPVSYMFDWGEYHKQNLVVRHRIPYSDLTSISVEQRTAELDLLDPIEFGHSMEQMFGGITDSGFAITGFFEDFAKNDLIAKYIANYYVVRAKRS